jgi:D-cysteine desulfhydrase
LEIDSINLDAFSTKGNLLIARDDAFPWFMGGNKARKMVKIISDIEKKNCNAVVTTGGIQSNHCRVVALACAAKGWKCKLVLHGPRKKFLSEKGNALLMRHCNSQLEFVNESEIGPVMDQSMNEFKARGFSPYYLYGGGHNKAGVTAYVEAVHELKNALPSDTIIDHIFLASGTGSTQAGIIAGCHETGWTQTKVHGISIARQNNRGIEAILESLGFIYANPDKFSNDIIFYDDFLFGGYGRSNQQLYDFIVHTANKTGVVLDETYTGKAFWGMIEIIKKEKLTGKILFWHTGGLLNLMA